ncbi:MAG: pantetheine-phosphate adenylyltransferase [Bacilli bacterium]|nr:pantetheine-phosphate adenylyltransferase [Bacilli bacterium]
MISVLYPGSFDPFTKGHSDVVEQAGNIFDEVIIAVMQNPLKKSSFFTLEERMEIIKELYKEREKIKVIHGSGAVVDIAEEYNCKAIIRGLRGLSDYDYEVSMAQINKELSNGSINTICLLADKNNQFISSSMVREIYNLGKDISRYVDPYVEEQMKLKRSL